MWVMHAGGAKDSAWTYGTSIGGGGAGRSTYISGSLEVGQTQTGVFKWWQIGAITVEWYTHNGRMVDIIVEWNTHNST